jgi:antitoxin YefM
VEAIPYSTVCANLARTLSRACHEPLIITRRGKPSVVILSLEEFQALEETAYLLRSPKNAVRLLSATAQLAAGGGVERNITE